MLLRKVYINQAVIYGLHKVKGNLYLNEFMAVSLILVYPLGTFLLTLKNYLCCQ